MSWDQHIFNLVLIMFKYLVKDYWYIGWWSTDTIIHSVFLCMLFYILFFRYTVLTKMQRKEINRPILWQLCSRHYSTCFYIGSCWVYKTADEVVYRQRNWGLEAYTFAILGKKKDIESEKKFSRIDTKFHCIVRERFKQLCITCLKFRSCRVGIRMSAWHIMKYYEVPSMVP